LGSALFFHSIAQYFNMSHSSSELSLPSSPNEGGGLSVLATDDVDETLETCVNHLTECLSSPWTALSTYNKILCFLCRGKTLQRLRRYEESIDDLSYCIRLYEQEPGGDAGEGEGHDEKEQGRLHDSNDRDFDSTDAAYAYFRRAWSYKVRSMQPSPTILS
jgi:hypothetical protein